MRGAGAEDVDAARRGEGGGGGGVRRGLEGDGAGAADFAPRDGDVLRARRRQARGLGGEHEADARRDRDLGAHGRRDRDDRRRVVVEHGRRGLRDSAEVVARVGGKRDDDGVAALLQCVVDERDGQRRGVCACRDGDGAARRGVVGARGGGARDGVGDGECKAIARARTSDGELRSGVAFHKLRRARGDRDRGEHAVAQCDGVRGGRSEHGVHRICERDDDRFERLGHAVVDERERDELHRLACGEGERARRERVIAAGGRGPADGILHGGAGGERAVEHGEQQRLRAIGLGAGAGGEQQAHARRGVIGIADGERVRDAGRRDAGEARVLQREQRGFIALGHAVVLHADADVLRSDAGREGERAAGDDGIARGGIDEGPIHVVARRGAATAGVLDGHGVGAGEVECHGDVAILAERTEGLCGRAGRGCEADAHGQRLIIRDVKRGARGQLRPVADARQHGDGDGLAAFHVGVIHGRQHEVRAKRGVGDRDRAGERGVVGAIHRGARDGVAHVQRARGAGAGEVELARRARGLGGRGVPGGNHHALAAVVILQPQRRRAVVIHAIRGVGRDRHDDGLRVFEERVIQSGNAHGHVGRAIRRDAHRAGGRGEVAARRGGAAHGVMHGDTPRGRADGAEDHAARGRRLGRRGIHPHGNDRHVVVVGDVHRRAEGGAEAVFVVEGGEAERDSLRVGFAEVVVVRRNHHRHADRARRDDDLARQRDVIRAVQRTAREPVIHRERRGGAARARDEHDARIGPGFGGTGIERRHTHDWRVVIGDVDRGGLHGVADVGGIRGNGDRGVLRPFDRAVVHRRECERHGGLPRGNADGGREHGIVRRVRRGARVGHHDVQRAARRAGARDHEGARVARGLARIRIRGRHGDLRERGVVVIHRHDREARAARERVAVRGELERNRLRPLSARIVHRQHIHHERRLPREDREGAEAAVIGERRAEGVVRGERGRAAHRRDAHDEVRGGVAVAREGKAAVRAALGRIRGLRERDERAGRRGPIARVRAGGDDDGIGEARRERVAVERRGERVRAGREIGERVVSTRVGVAILRPVADAHAHERLRAVAHIAGDDAAPVRAHIHHHMPPRDAALHVGRRDHHRHLIDARKGAGEDRRVRAQDAVVEIPQIRDRVAVGIAASRGESDAAARRDRRGRCGEGNRWGLIAGERPALIRDIERRRSGRVFSHDREMLIALRVGIRAPDGDAAVALPARSARRRVEQMARIADG